MTKTKTLVWWQTSFIAFGIFFVINLILNALGNAFAFLNQNIYVIFSDDTYKNFLYLLTYIVSFIVACILLQLYISKVPRKTYILFGIMAVTFVLLYPFITVITQTNIYNELAFNEETILCGHKPVVASDFIERIYTLPGEPGYESNRFLDSAYFCTAKQAQTAGY